MKKVVKFSSNAWLDYIHWKKNNQVIRETIDKYLLEILETPFEGNGYPQSLSYDLSNVWSRRINLTHRLVYMVTEDEIQIVQCRFHF